MPSGSTLEAGAVVLSVAQLVWLTNLARLYHNETIKVAFLTVACKDLFIIFTLGLLSLSCLPLLHDGV